MSNPRRTSSSPSLPVFLSFLFLLILGIPALAEGQGATITGRVTSEQGTPLEIATVYITELNLASTTDEQGRYTLTVPAARVTGQSVVLRVRRIGHLATSRTITLTPGAQTVDFSLRQDFNRLDEVVVTGVIGEGVERSKVPFSVGRVTAEDLPVPALDPIRALAGKVSGMRIAQTSGQPGSTPEIMLRGPTSLNASGRGQGPLIVVDGAILNVGNLEELGALDIESVEVVKGAAGASLYGTRAANGVISIKTKRGATEDGVTFSVRSEYGLSDINSVNYGLPVNHHLQLDETGKRFCVAGSNGVQPCSRSMDFMSEILRINNVNADTTRTPQPFQWNNPAASGGELQNVFQANIWPNRYYNPLAQLVRRNPVIMNAVDARGRVGSVGFYVSGSYQDEAGAFVGLSGQQHRRGRVNLDYDMRSDVRVSVSTLYDKATTDLRGIGFGTLLRGAPTGVDYTARDTLGRPLVRAGGSGIRGTGNGAATFLHPIENSASDREAERFLGNISVNYFPLEWATFEAQFAYDNRQRRDFSHLVKGYRTQNVSSSANEGNMSIGNRAAESFNGSLTATFQRQLRSDLNGRLSLRSIFDQDEVQTNSSYGEVFLVKDVYTLNNTSANEEASSSSTLVRNMGFSVAASADYLDRYVLEGSLRYDGSSLFGAGNRWAPFGRVSGVWRVSEEPFFAVPHLSDFRLRASLGTAGNTPRFDAQYETYNVSATGITLGQAGNAKLKPETTTELEIGTDFTLFDRLGVELTNARSETRDQILPVNTPASLGFTTQWQNAGTLENNTWEAAVNLGVVNTRDFEWSMRGTWDRTRTYITELFTPEFFGSAGTGQGTGTAFLYTARTDKNNGVPVNRYGNIWGRKFYRSCGDLPQGVRSQCGPNQAFQVNDQGWVVWTGEGNSWRDGITKNLWQTKLPAAQSPWNVPLFFGHPIIDRPLRGEKNEGIGINQVIGNVMPDFRLAWSNNVRYKRFTLYGLLDGTFGHDIINQGEGWGLLDFNSAYFDQGGKSVETAKPLGYGWRVGGSEGAGTGGFYDQLGPNNYSVEEGTYMKLREVSLTYRAGAIAGIGDFTLGLVGRNLLTITDYSGYDPEVGVSGGTTGSGLINQVDAFDFPTLRTYTFSISTRF